MKQPIFNVKMDNLISLVDFVGLMGKNGVFVKKMLNFILKKGVHERFVTEEGEILSVFYGTSEKIKPTNLYIDRRAVRYFAKKYEADLLELGVNPDYLKVIILNIPRVQTGVENGYSLWATLSKISPNTKCVSELCQYVKDNFLADEYTVVSPSGYMSREKIFAFSKGKAGRAGFVIKKDAYDFFMKHYKECLKKEAHRLDENSNVIGVRLFLRELNMMENKDIDFKKFVIKKCLNETFDFVDENGNVQTLPCFSYSQNRYLNIDKRGIQSFVTRHEKELKALGFKNFNHVIENKSKLITKQGYLSLMELSESLRYSALKAKFKDFLSANGTDHFYMEDATGKQIPFFQEFYYHGQKRFYIKKENVPLFLKKYSDVLEDFGVRKEYIDDRSGVQKISYKTSDMIGFEEFYLRLGTDARFHVALSKKIQEQFKNERYESLDENKNLSSREIFKTVRSGISLSMVFVNETALKSFMSHNREFLISEGIKKESIEHFLGEKPALDYSDAYVPLYNLEGVLHRSKHDLAKIVRENYLDETYSVVDKNGTITQENMFVPMRHAGKGSIFYAIKRDALLEFAKRHQEEFKISDIVIDELSGKLKIVEKTDDYISLPNLYRGCSKDNRRAINQANKFIVQNCLNDMYVTTSEVGTLMTKPIFSYARHTKSGTIMLCIDTNGIESFFKNRGPELKKMGIFPFAFVKQVKETKKTMKSVIFERLKTLGRV